MECFKYDKMCNIELYVHNFVLQMQILCGLACSHFSVFGEVAASAASLIASVGHRVPAHELREMKAKVTMVSVTVVTAYQLKHRLTRKL